MIFWSVVVALSLTRSHKYMICLHDVSPMYTRVWKVLREYREERQDNARGTRYVLISQTVTMIIILLGT